VLSRQKRGELHQHFVPRVLVLQPAVSSEQMIMPVEHDHQTLQLKVPKDQAGQ
jgi:hypothetical protein